MDFFLTEYVLVNVDSEGFFLMACKKPSGRKIDSIKFRNEDQIVINVLRPFHSVWVSSLLGQHPPEDDTNTTD